MKTWISIVSLCFAGSSWAGQPGVRDSVTPERAKSLAIAYAEADRSENHYYGGEEEIRDVTEVVTDYDEERLLGGFLSMMIRDRSPRVAELLKAIHEDSDLEWELTDGSYYFVSVDYVDCEQIRNYLGVNRETGKVVYLFRMSL